MPVLHLDWETRGIADLPEVGLDNYALHPNTDIWLASYAFDDEPVQTWWPKDACPQAILSHIESGGLVVGHNVQFEILINNLVAGPRYGWPVISPDQCVCTMAMAYGMGLPGSLEHAAAAAGLDMRKDAAGSRVMLQLCRPKSMSPSGEIIWWTDPAKIEMLRAYGVRDVEIERELYRRLIPLSDKERAVWRLDYDINRRGIQMDLPAVRATAGIVLQEQDRLDQELRRITGSAVSGTTKIAELTKWVRAQGVEIAGLAKADILDALNISTLPKVVRQALLIRQEAGRASTAKLRKIVAAAGSDGRVRGTKQYHGAATGRWAGRTIQPDNFPRPSLSPGEVENAVALILAGARDKLELLYGPPMAVAADCLRGMITAAPGNVLLAGDFVGIENAVLPWLAGEEWKLQAIRDQNTGTGPKVYLIAAAKIKHVDPTQYTKASPEYLLGKISELSLGYQGGLGAFRNMERGLGLDLGLTDPQVQMAKDAWREAHPKIVEYWNACESAAVSAVLNPGMAFTAGAQGREVKYKKVGSFLFCGLPSKRAICYPYPKILEIETPWGGTKDAVTYMKVVSASGAAKDKVLPDQAASGQWQRVSTYGGKLAENNTQAFARDLLVDAMLRLAAAGFYITMHVHDEIVVEAPGSMGEEIEAEFTTLMAAIPPYAAGLPIAVETWMAQRYRK